MEYITLGKTGLRVSRMGFGGIPIQKVDASVTHALMERLAQRGVNYIDTARGYTVSEQFLGEALEGGLREKFVIATKSMARTKEAMARDIDISLKNLRTDYIDLYQIHNPSLAELEQVLAPGGALEALMEAKAAGKIRHLGLTAHMAAVFERALELDWVETVMFPYNIVETQGEELMAKCREKNVGFICMKPMAGGALEDARLALRFIRQNENVSVVIPGMYDIREIDENLSAMEDISALTSDELAKIETIRKELGTQFCRRCNYCQPCTAGISISGIFVLEGYLQRYGLGDWAQKRYDALNKKAGDCVGCGACEKRCPYQLPIRQMLARCKQEFGA
jgi:oxidoreductase